jgi:uncharacterized damage-inducible protein DinB
MLTTIEHFKNSWGYESASTLKLMNELTDKSLSQQVGDGYRTLGRLAWHIVLTIPEMANRTGLHVEGPSHDTPTPASADVIKKGYEQASKSLMQQVTSSWKDDTLQIEDDMYGEKWKRGASLSALINHEVHHRGQMSVLMRQANLKVPGVYGPAKEEWTQYGMKEPEV